MARKPGLDKYDSPIRRLTSGDRRTPSPAAKAIGNVFLVLAILMIGIGAAIGFAQGVKKEPKANDATAVTTANAEETTATETTTEETTTTVTTAQTTQTQVL